MKSTTSVFCVSVLSAMSVFADATISENMTLSSDLDWRSDGVVTVEDGVTVDLNGYNIWVAGLAGSGTFTSSVVAPSGFDLTTAQTDDTYVKSYSGSTEQALGTEFVFSIQPAWKLFADYSEYDYLKNQRAITSFDSSTPVDIVYDFSESVFIDCYKIQVSNDPTSYKNRAPAAWKFYGSNTAEDNSWTELDSREVTDWTQYEKRTFSFPSSASYRYYRIRITANGGDTVLEFFSLEYGRLYNQVRIDPSQSVGFRNATTTADGNAKYVLAGGTLNANIDLRGLGNVTLDGDIDLNGLVLYAPTLDGEGEITSSVATSSAFDITTAQTDDTYVKSYFGDSTTATAFNLQPAWKAFANYSSYSSTQRVIDTTGNYPAHIVYDFQTSTFVNAFKMQTTSDASSATIRAPKEMTFSGSDDGSSWTTLTNLTETGWSKSESRTFTFANEKAYRYYRLTIKSSNGAENIFEFFKLEYGRRVANYAIVGSDSDLSGVSESGYAQITTPLYASTLTEDVDAGDIPVFVDGTVDLNGHTLTVAGLVGDGTITDSTEFDLTDATASRVSSDNKFLSTGPAAAAFGNYSGYDASKSQRVIAQLAANTMPIAITYQFDAATVVNAYRLKVGGNGSSDSSSIAALKKRAPKSFALWGSNTGADGSWTKLDERTNETVWYIATSLQEERQYEFTNTTAYVYYKIEFYENNGNAYLEFFKLEYGNLDNVGKLRVNVDDGVESENATVAIKGNLRLVKDGSGTFYASKSSQTYECGTEVIAGTLNSAVQGNSLPFGACGRDIVVRSDSIFEVNNAKNYYLYGITLDGGKLVSAGDDIESTNAQFKRMRLTADSTFVPRVNSGFIGDGYTATTIDLGGHTLVVRIASGKKLWLYNTTMLNGTISNTEADGAIYIRGDSGVVATNVNFLVDNFAMNVGASFDVGGYEAGSTMSNVGTETMRVFGTFKPKNTYYYGCQMQDGSTIDFTGGVTLPLTNVAFASSANVAVNLAGRDDLKTLAKSENPYLITWKSGAPSATFTLDAETAAAFFKVVSDETGLRLENNAGLIILFR